MKKILLPALMVLAAHGLSSPQVQRGVHGTVTQSGNSQPIAFAQVVLNVAPTPQFIDAATAALTAEGAPASIMQGEIERLLAMPLQALQAMIDTGKAQGAPPEALASLMQAQSFRASRPDFPMRGSTDAAGRFAFPNVPPGTYTMTIQKNGFFGAPVDEKGRPTDSASATVSVPAQGDGPEIAVSMLAGAVIEGTIRDASGEPIANVNVQAVAVATPGSPPSAAPPPVKTNEAGEYRLYWLRPGDYRVSVTPPSVQPASQAYVRTFFPDAIDQTAAVPLSLKPGDALSGINIILQNGAGSGPQSAGGAAGNGGFKVSGQVVNTVRMLTDASGKAPATTATLVLVPRSTSTGYPGPIRTVGAVAVTSQTSSFEVSNIAPGSYDLYARLADTVASEGRGPGRGLYVFGHSAIDVSNRDLDNVTITIHSPVDVNGRLIIDGVVDPERSKTLRVEFSTIGSANAFPNYQGANFGPQTPKPDGTFTVPNVAEATYLTHVAGITPNWYVADVRMSGASVYDSGFSIAEKTPEPVEITIATNGGIVEGVVTGADQKPATNTQVVLVPPVDHRKNEVLYKTAITDSMGRFTFRGIRPDDYKVFAWEGMLPGNVMNPEVLAKYESQGAAVTVQPSATARVDVAIIPKPAPQ